MKKTYSSDEIYGLIKLFEDILQSHYFRYSNNLKRHWLSSILTIELAIRSFSEQTGITFDLSKFPKWAKIREYIDLVRNQIPLKKEDEPKQKKSRRRKSSGPRGNAKKPRQ